ncbi:MAG TPA: hypothetical protein VIV11_11105 [Kofleriaceae bacterium]
MTARTVVEQALAALRSVSVPGVDAKTTRDAADEIDRAWKRSPLVAGLEGNLVARSELVNTIVGEKVLDPYRRALGSAPLRIRRGPVMRYRAVRFDDSVEEKTAPEPEPRDGDEKLDERASEARDELLQQETALATVERSLPVVVRRKPKPWAVWLWPLRWLFGLVRRNTVASWRVTLKMVDSARHKLAGIEGFVAARDQRERAAREAYYGELRILCGGGPAGKDVRSIELFIPHGLPANVELVELMGALRASADIDAVIVVERDALYAPTPDGDRVELGAVTETLAELPTVLERARSLTLARRALAKLFQARAEVDVEINRAETQFQLRMQRLTKLALPLDIESFRAAQLQRVRPTLIASINAVMEHASVHMGSELAQLGAGWMNAIIGAKHNDDLKAGVAMIEAEWPTSARRIAEEVHVLVMGGAGGVARDLYVETVTALRAYGLPEEHLKTPKRAPDIEPVQILAALSNPTTFTLGGSWFAGLFKSFEARRADIRAKVQARIEHIREVAAAEILDTEPKLHAAVGQALAAQLDAAIEAQRSSHQQTLAAEQTAIAKEREALAPLVKTRDAIVSVGSQLAQLANAVQAERPAVAAAAVAAAS